MWETHHILSMKIFVCKDFHWRENATKQNCRLRGERHKSEVCIDEETRLRTFVHKGKEQSGGIIISNQPIIFHITYTPWKLKSNASEKDRAKFERERPYYEMSDSGNNIYKYMTSDRKLNGENSKSGTRSLIEYFEKSTGVFNGDGVITQEQLKAIQERAKAPKNLGHGFFSLNE